MIDLDNQEIKENKIDETEDLEEEVSDIIKSR